MVPHSSHTNHEFLILVIWVTNVSFAIEVSVTYEKELLIMLHTKKTFLLLKFFIFRIFFVSFLFFNMANLLQTKLWQILQKNRSEKYDQNPQKHLQRINQLWNCKPETLLPKPLCMADHKISGYFLIQISFFLSGIFYTNIHESQDCRRRGGGISLTPHYHFHPLHKHLDISWAITAESSPLHIASSWTQTANLWFLSASLLLRVICVYV